MSGFPSGFSFPPVEVGESRQIAVISVAIRHLWFWSTESRQAVVTLVPIYILIFSWLRRIDRSTSFSGLFNQVLLQGA